MMKKFTKKEVIGLSVIFLVLFLMSFPNFALSIKRQRDSVRKSGLGNITTWVKEFQEAYSYFPYSTDDGRMIACLKEGETALFDKDGLLTNTFVPCGWGEKSILGDLPKDPDWDKGVSFVYLSTGTNYQIYSALEDAGDDEYSKSVYGRNLNCGSRICNTGRSSKNAPVDKSLTEYENEINAGN